MLRALSEFAHPEKKCARIGHDLRERSRRVYLYPPAPPFASMSVADRATEIATTCARCGHVDGVEMRDRTGLQGLTLNTDKWELLRREGRYEP